MSSQTGEVDAQLLADIAPISQLSSSGASSLCDLVLGFLLNTSRDFQTELGAWAEQNTVDTKVLKSLVRSLLVFLQGAIREGWSVPQLESRCVALGLEPRATAVLSASYKSYSSQMVTSLLARTVTANRLVDMDWSFGVTASSDDCDQVGKTFLQLKLTIDRGDEGTAPVFLELSLDQFYQVLASLEKTQQVLELMDRERPV